MNHVSTPLTSQIMRTDLFTYFPLLQNAPLKQFLHDVFACDEMVQAYLLPMKNQPPHAQHIVLAVEVATAVVRQVRHSPWLHNHTERELATVAALVKYCGHFLVALRQQPASVQKASQAKVLALEDALRKLRYTSPEIGQTLSAVLGQEAGDNFDSMQVARIYNILIAAGMRRKVR